MLSDFFQNGIFYELHLSEKAVLNMCTEILRNFFATLH